jgi:hypothetical protein
MKGQSSEYRLRKGMARPKDNRHTHKIGNGKLRSVGRGRDIGKIISFFGFLM